MLKISRCERLNRTENNPAPRQTQLTDKVAVTREDLAAARNSRNFSTHSHMVTGRQRLSSFTEWHIRRDLRSGLAGLQKASSRFPKKRVN
jgi:hypothetical protein